MIRNILAVGDSFTYGEELADRDYAWPCLVSRKLNAAINNMAMPGSGNTRIVRNVIENAALNDIVLVGWTSPGRIEFADTDGIFDTWPGHAGKHMHHPWRSVLVEYVSKNHDPRYLYRQYLVNVILTQTYLKAHNVKYLMMLTVANEYYRKTFGGEFSELREQVDSSHFVDPGYGMMEWANKTKKGAAGHFLDEGHQIVADKVLHKINEMGWA